VATPVAAVDAKFALKSAAAFASPAEARYRDLVDEDAWTHSKALDGHRPLHRVDIDDEARTLLYVSGRTGEVVRRASATERQWGWIGAWLHWLYPFRGGAVDRWWTEIIIYTSLAGALLGVTGLVSGILRWRRRPYPHGSRSPYRDWLMRWHHWLGLAFGLLLLTWIVSGLLSVNPWQVFDSGAPRPQLAKLVLVCRRPADETRRALHCFNASPGYRFGNWNGGPWAARPLCSLAMAPGVAACRAPRLIALPFEAHELDALRAAGESMLPDARVSGARLQSAYDWYYYDRATHSMTGHVGRPLPVLVLEFDDPAAELAVPRSENGGSGAAPR
jgi:hypothetical protein